VTPPRALPSAWLRWLGMPQAAITAYEQTGVLDPDLWPDRPAWMRLSVLPASPRDQVTREPIQGKTARGVVLDDFDGDYVDPGK
jgi:hypothetical protein